MADLDGDHLPEIIVSSTAGDFGGARETGEVRILKPYRRARVDVRPDSDPNVVYVPNWVCFARLYGVSRTDPIDPATVRLAGAPATHRVQQDYDGDGIDDVPVYVDTSQMHLGPHATSIALIARTRSGALLAGSDQIVVAPTPH